MQVKNWEVTFDNWLYRKFLFKDFAVALKFVNQVGELCEQQNHHANIEFGWGFVKIKVQTHDVKNLTNKDFLLAKEINNISQVN